MTTRSEYKGSELICLRWQETDKFPFMFGRGKAKLILANLDAIKEFVEEEGKPKEKRKHKFPDNEEIPF